MRLVARERRLGLQQRCLKWPRIQREKQIALLNELPFLHMDFIQDRVHLRLDRNVRERLGRSNRRQINGNGFLYGLGDDHARRKHRRRVHRFRRAACQQRQRSEREDERRSVARIAIH